MADIKNIDVYQTVSSVSFEVEPITNIININKVTIEGTGGGSQNLQQVTDIGASTTNTITLNPIVNTNGLNINTTFDENISGVSTAVNINQTGEGNGIYINTPNGQALSILGGGNGTGIIINDEDVGIYLNPNTTGLAVSGGSGESINIINTTGTGVRIFQSIESANELNLGTTAKGVVINSGASSTGNPIQIVKETTTKLSVNQQGELTATKLIKEGGTSAQYLMADGSVSSGSSGGGIKNTIASGTDTYTATISGVTSYTDGDTYLVRFTNGNTTNCSLNINSLGVVALYRNNDGALIGGDIQNGGEMLCVYNSALNAFQCIGTSPNDIISYVTNADSVTITKGQPVYAFGGVGDRMTVKLAYNTLDSSSAQTVGLVMSASIAAGQKGIIITQGQLDGLNILSTFNDGDTVYLGATSGTITNVKPYAPNHLVYLGIVTTKSLGSAGRMYVRVQNGYELDELHNVQAQNPTLKDTLYFDNTVTPNQWKTASISTILGYTPYNATNPSGYQTASQVQAIADAKIVQTITNGVTTTAPSQDAVFDALALKANDASVVHLTGAETIAGVKTFSSNPKIPVNGGNGGIGALVIDNGTGQIEIATNYLYPNLVEIQYVKGVTSSIQTQFSGKQDTLVSTSNIKSINGNSILGAGNLTISTPSQSAFTVLANNTNASAVPTEQVYRDVAEQTNLATVSTITWSGTTLPTNPISLNYKWEQIGSLVVVRFNLVYTTAGSANTQVTITLPTDMPNPGTITGFTSSTDVLGFGSGSFSSSRILPSVNGIVALRKTATSYEFVMTRTSGNINTAWLSFQYFT
jgi:hypothetical protein